MKWKQRTKTASGFAFAVSTALIGSLMFASPALAAVETIQINPGNVPTTAEEFETQSCDNIPPGDISKTEDGWVFVLPASAGADGNFISVTAFFEDENGDDQTLTTGANGGIVSGSGDNKAYIISPPGWTLVGAEAEVNDPDEDAFFNLTHTCPGKPGDGPTTPGEEPTTPGEEPTTPGEEPTTPGEEPTTPGESPTAPGEKTTGAAAGLPTTGASTGFMLALGLILAAGGTVLIMFLRRRAQTQDF